MGRGILFDKEKGRVISILTFTFTNDYINEFKKHVDKLYKSSINDVIRDLKREVSSLETRLGESDNLESEDRLLETIEELEADIKDLFEEKVEITSSLIESYFGLVGETPNSIQLDRLSTWVIKHSEHDDEEFDIKTKRQLQRIYKEREVLYDSNEIDDLVYEDDGNRVVKPKVNSDDNGNHRIRVSLDYDKEPDKRKYNAPVKRYNLNDTKTL